MEAHQGEPLTDFFTIGSRQKRENVCSGWHRSIGVKLLPTPTCDAERSSGMKPTISTKVDMTHSRTHRHFRIVPMQFNLCGTPAAGNSAEDETARCTTGLTW